MGFCSLLRVLIEGLVLAGERVEGISSRFEIGSAVVAAAVSVLVPVVGNCINSEYSACRLFRFVEAAYARVNYYFDNPRNSPEYIRSGWGMELEAYSSILVAPTAELLAAAGLVADHYFVRMGSELAVVQTVIVSLRWDLRQNFEGSSFVAVA